MPVFFFIYCYLMRVFPEALNNAHLYWGMNGGLFLIMGVYLFKKSEKTVLNLFFSFCILLMSSYDLINYITILFTSEKNDFEYFSEFLILTCGIVCYVFIVKDRHDWKKMKSVKYDPYKVQAIYSAPNSLITILGVAISLSPKCSVRYTYLDKTIRFKRGVKTPILCDTVIKKTDIIENTNLTDYYFINRWVEIKNKRFNLFTFNCRMLCKN